MINKQFAIYYFSGTHWDREWYQSFQGFRYRLVEMMNEMIEVLENTPDFKVFHFDGQSIILEDYMRIEPQNRDRLQQLIKEGRILVGPWYVMPDEFLLSGESLIRNLMTGHKITSEWGGSPWKYGYICDIFGHIAQMPQIFKGFGIDFALLGRGTNEHNCPAHFLWESPDGSNCITFKLPDKNGYGCFSASPIFEKQEDSEELKQLLEEHIEGELNRSDIPIVLLMDGTDHQHIRLKTPDYIDKIRELFPQAEVFHDNIERMGEKLKEYSNVMPVKKGELNETAKAKGGYLHLITHTLSSRYPIKKNNDECQTLLEKWVEPLVVMAQENGLCIQKTYVDEAYKFLIQNHPHDSICGCSIDQVHKDMEYRFNQSEQISEQLISAIINHEKCKHSKENTSNMRVLSIFNPLPFPRREVIALEIDFNTDYPTRYQEPFGYETINSFKVYDVKGNEIPYGIVEKKKNYRIRRYNQFVEWADVYKISMEIDVPAMGVAEYKIEPFNEASRYLDVLCKNNNQVENEYIKLTVNDNGTLNILDKISGKSYKQLLSYLDDGEIGDGWYHVSPLQNRIVNSLGAPCTIELVENGPSRTVFRIVKYMTVPECMHYHNNGIDRSDEAAKMEITSWVGLSKEASYVDVETIVKNIARDHRLRLALPTNVDSDKYFVNQPFAFVERNTGINYDTQEWKECEVPEKQMGGIVGKRSMDGSGLAFISAYGLHECAGLDDENQSILVTLFRSFGKTTRTNGEDGGQILGDLSFKYCIVPLQKDTTYGQLIKMQDCIQTGVRSVSFRVAEDYMLANHKSYFMVESENICTSIIKRPENGKKNVVIIRLCNMSSDVSTAKLKCFKQIVKAEEVNMNENYIADIRFEQNYVNITMSGWKIRTISLEF